MYTAKAREIRASEKRVRPMVDDKKPLPQPMKVKETDGTERTLRTYGDKWSYLQRTKFGSNAQPYYVIVNQEGMPLNHSFPYSRHIPRMSV